MLASLLLLIDVYLYVVLLRLVLQTLKFDYQNPMSQFAIKFTQPIIKPLQRIIPEVHGLDLAIVTFLIILEFIKYTGLMALQFHTAPHILGLLVISIGDLFNKLIKFYFYAIIARVILSWISAKQHAPILFALTYITEPLLRRLRPTRGLRGFDFSPLIALVLLQILSILLSASSLMHMGARFL